MSNTRVEIVSSWTPSDLEFEINHAIERIQIRNPSASIIDIKPWPNDNNTKMDAMIIYSFTGSDDQIFGEV